MILSQPFVTDSTTAVRLGLSHGYRIDGDIACLNAEIAAHGQDALSKRWSLQLWACDAPHGGGPLSGIKVAEAALELPDHDSAQPQRLYAEAFARLPAGARDYSMVLVLASDSGVQDFANYPARESFAVPALAGAVSCSIKGESVQLHVERIHNPRDTENLSGTLALELWALAEPYSGGQFTGTALAGLELGRLSGQDNFLAIDRQLALSQLPCAQRHAVLMLREWTAAGYVTRDYQTLPNLLQPSAAPIQIEAPAAPLVLAAPAAVPAPLQAPITVDSPVDLAVDLSAPSVPAPGPAAATPAALVSIQTASVEELAVVPGLNRKLAVEIIKARPFRSLDDLLKLRGIGDKTLRRLRTLLTL